MDTRPDPGVDFEVDVSWSANAVRGRRVAEARTSTHGDIERCDELTEPKPEAAQGKRWRLRAWLRR